MTLFSSYILFIFLKMFTVRCNVEHVRSFKEPGSAHDPLHPAERAELCVQQAQVLRTTIHIEDRLREAAKKSVFSGPATKALSSPPQKVFTKRAILFAKYCNKRVKKQRLYQQCTLEY